MTRQDKALMTMQSYAFTTIVSAWLVTGTLDISAALTYYPLKYGIPQTRLLQNIASAIFGGKAFAGGLQMAMLGLVIHYCVALFWTIVCFICYPAVMIFRRNRFVVGITYGIVVWLVMNLLVLPISKVHRSPFDFIQALIGALTLIICIGLPNSILIGKYYTIHKSSTNN